MDKGVIISGIGHFSLILWLLFGDWFFQPQHAPEVAVTSVSLMTSAEFDAMTSAATQPSEQRPTPSVEPEQPAPPPEEAAPAPAPAPVAETPPPLAPEPRPEPAPQPDAAPTAPEIAPVPEPEIAEAPEPLAPVAEVEQPILVPQSSPRPKPKPAPRVAPTPAPAPPPEAEVAEVPTPPVAPDPQTPAPEVVEEKPPAAPEEATTEIVTETTETEEVAQLAPTSSARPKVRPQRARAPEPAAEEPRPASTSRTETAAAEPAETPAERPERPAAETPRQNDSRAVEDALAEALGGGTEPASERPSAPARSGPPVTSGEKDAFRIAVQQCWNVGALSTEALATTVTVAMSMRQDGTPDAGSIRMIESRGGTDAGARQAFEAARRAIIRCGTRGFPLPPEKYDQWREVEMEFDPNGMRMK
ncbi:cell envelope biogenesis protein TolA [Cereibacter azotoformans]|uniref:Cell division and transport-associated protein TolA n=1 Tax=Cereibacter azotoformans TaxID=43057 RepID=A0A2T5JXJ7_9RHOB|nr:cell envelope biogenesis protein TolA [Cereibacter azotoformans]MBO4169599.1 cell envelope biogenesis protein TolA [Cereibacter azotoformans]PTR14876.1 cell division and transport-associated protein TolA [Cereibacter azotoformans]